MEICKKYYRSIVEKRDCAFEAGGGGRGLVGEEVKKCCPKNILHTFFLI